MALIGLMVLCLVVNGLAEDRLVVKDGLDQTSFKVDDTGTIYSSSSIGVGTDTPERRFHLKGSNAVARIDRPENSASFMLVRTDPSGSSVYKTFVIGVDAAGVNNGNFFIRDNGTETSGNGLAVRVFIDNQGRVGIGTTSPQGKLDVNGAIYQRGFQVHADYVFDQDYVLESIEEHARYMWEHKHLKSVPAAVKDADGREVIETGAHLRGILEELEKAHIYIERLNQRIAELEKTIAKQ